MIRSIAKWILHQTNYANDFHVFRTILRKNVNYSGIQKSWKDTPVGKSGLEFFDWFDSVSSIEDIEKNAKRDFDYAVEKYLDISSDKSILEIGFGGGRLASVACQRTKNYFGIDIHENFECVEQFLRSRGHNNFRLFRFPEIKELPKFDFAYSFIVIQHFERIEILESYLDILYRNLEDGGSAVLWYAKLNLKVFKYYEVPPGKFRKRECSLYIHRQKMEELISERGFSIIKHNIHNFTSDFKRKSGQSMILIKKDKRK